jgi:gluconolactonase
VTDSPYEHLDPEFRRCVNRHARVERLYAGCRWAEGPAWFPAHGRLVWSDIPNDRLLCWDEATGAVGEFRKPSNFANGNTIDRQGRLVSCEHGARRVTRTEHDGAVTVLADRFEGRRFNSPNDVVVRADDSAWFTDPDYGIAGWYEGEPAEPELDGRHVYRWDPRSGAVARVLDDFDRPNGLAFSPDERRLYVADSGAPRHIRVFEVDADGRLSGGAVFAEAVGDEVFDGFRLDEAGRLWTSAGDGVACYAPDGRRLGRVTIGETVANLCFGGPRRNRLFVCASTSLYALLLPVRG